MLNLYKLSSFELEPFQETLVVVLAHFVELAVKTVPTIVEKDVGTLASNLCIINQILASERTSYSILHLRNVVADLFLLLCFSALLRRGDCFDLLLPESLVHSAALVIAKEILDTSVLFNLLISPACYTSSQLSSRCANDLVSRNTSLLIVVLDESLDLVFRELLACDCFDGGVFLHDL